MLILNEKKHVEDLLKNHNYEKNPYFDLRLIAIYMRVYDAVDDKEVFELLIDELSKHCAEEYFKRRDKWHSICEKLVANTKGCRLIELDGVPITKKEMDMIIGINDFRLERLAFTMLVMAKYNHMANPMNDGWVNYNDKIVFDYANVRCRTSDRVVMLGQLLELGLIEIPKKNTVSNERITFIDDSDEDVVLTITDTRRLGMQYQNFVGDGDFSICEKCGLIVRSSKFKAKRYCSKCGKDVHREIDRASKAVKRSFSL